MFFHSLKELKEYHSSRKEEIAMAFGCFDILHQGHIRFFEKARKHTKLPIAIGILDDTLVRHMKGENRPIRGERERAEVVDAVRFIDETFLVKETGDFSLYRTKYGLSDSEKELWIRCMYCLDVIHPKEFYYSTDFPMTASIRKFFEDRKITATPIPYTEGISTSILANRLKGDR